MPVGYSGTPLLKKLGFKKGFSIKLINEPDDYYSFFQDWPEDVIVSRKKPYDAIHIFSKEKAELTRFLKNIKTQLKPAGMVWISWPKKASKVVTDLDGGIVRKLGIANDLVDVKVCAVSKIWSGHKFVIPVKDR